MASDNSKASSSSAASTTQVSLESVLPLSGSSISPEVVENIVKAAQTGVFDAATNQKVVRFLTSIGYPNAMQSLPSTSTTTTTSSGTPARPLPGTSTSTTTPVRLAGPTAGVKRKESIRDTTPGPALPVPNARPPNAAYTNMPQRSASTSAMPSPTAVPPRPNYAAPGMLGVAAPGIHATAGAAAAVAPVAGKGLRKDAATEQAMRQAIRGLLSSVDPTMRLESEVEDMLLEVADEFLESATNFSARLAAHRKSDALEVKDLQLHLDRHHNIRIPGFAGEEATKVPASTVPAPVANPTTGGRGKRGGAKGGLRSTRLSAVKATK